MSTFFSADLHLGHQRICDFASRPFSSVEEMNETLIENWNKTVGPNDIGWILGDVVMGHIDKTLPLIARMNGTKILLCGNHDRPWIGYGIHYRASAKQRQTDWIERYKRVGGFHAVHDGRLKISQALTNDIRVQMSHFPYTGDHTADERYLEYRPTDDGSWLLHGHVHEEWKIDVPNRQLNVGVDVWDYTPVSESTLVDLILDSQ